jgi:hypothetical protein
MSITDFMEFVRQLVSSGFFGEIVVKFRAGKIVHLVKSESIDLGE